MKLYHIKNCYGSDKLVIASDRSAFYSFRNNHGNLSGLKKVFSDSRGWTIVASEDGRKGVSLNLVEVDYSMEFSYERFKGEDRSLQPMCDYVAVKKWLDKKHCKLLPGQYCRYAISKNGKVFRVFDRAGRLNPKRVRPGKITNGYLQLKALGIDGSHKYILVHRLVAYMFMNLPWDSRLDIDHINADKEDNRLSNLRVCTRSENLHYFRKRVVKIYMKHGRDIAKTARAMNITQEKVANSLSIEKVL